MAEEEEKKIENEINEIPEDDEVEEIFWRLGWLALALTAIAAVIFGTGILDLQDFLQPCLLHSLTGFYCPGCGGTRALQAFFHGQFLTSFYYHPIVPYCLILYFCFMFSQTLKHLSHGKIHGLKYHVWYMTVLLILLIGEWIVKNAALFFGYVWMA